MAAYGRLTLLIANAPAIKKIVASETCARQLEREIPFGAIKRSTANEADGASGNEDTEWHPSWLAGG